MSSLRPLATIALLAAVGVFLYMKINETEPKLSPELEEWSTSTLDIGAEEEFAAAPTGDAGTVTLALPPASGSGAAPAFGSAQLNPAPAATTAPAGAAAPPWLPSSVATLAPGAKTPNAESSPVARSAETTPALPDMPALPGGDSATSAGAAPAFGAAGAATAAATLSNPAPPATSAATLPAAAGADVAPAATPAAAPQTKSSMFAAARVAVSGALDRGELAQALSMLSEWYGDPSLTPAETKEVNDLLSQLAGSVIYEGPPAHRLLPAHLVKDGETLETIAAKYNVPWQLLAKINGLPEREPLTPGQALKVVQGPFSAVIDLSERKMTLKLERRYAGQFPLEMDPTASIEEGEWKVDQKLLTPGAGGIYASASTPTEDRSLLLANIANPTGQAAVLRGPGASDPMSAQSAARVLRLKSNDVTDVYDILSIGSRVTIQR